MLIDKRVDITADEDISPPPQGLWVGGAGNVHVQYADGTETTIQGVQAGTLLPDAIIRVISQGTTATLLQACYGVGR